MENVLGIAHVLEIMENVKMTLFMLFFKGFKVYWKSGFNWSEQRRHDCFVDIYFLLLLL